MSAATAPKPIVHFVAASRCQMPRRCSVPQRPQLHSPEAPPDGEIWHPQTWIRFLYVLADNPAIEVASDVPAFKLTQWDGSYCMKLRLRVKPGAARPGDHHTGYADMAIE